MNRVAILFAADANSKHFTDDFLDWLPQNTAIFDAFATETLKVISLGFTHYSARTILHVIRHHSALTEKGDSGWKVNNNHSPYLGRLFEFVYPQHAGIFNHRATPAVKRENQEASS